MEILVKKLTFIISLFVILSVNTILPMKRSAADLLESSSKLSHPQPGLENYYIHNCLPQDYNKSLATQKDISITEEEIFFITEEANLTENYAITPLLATIITDSIFPTISATLSKPYASKVPPKKFVCTFEACKKSYTSNKALTIHIHTHTQGKPYTCTFCGASYTAKSNLNKHMQIHQK